MDVEARAEPLVSCLMISWGRPDLLKRAIAQYVRQTWRSKELIVVLGSGEREAEAYLGDLRRSDVRVVIADGLPTIPRFRNIAVDSARGDILCQWDDDDLYHPLRVEQQVRHLQREKADASIFGDHLHYFKDSNELWWADWSRWGSGHPGTLMCRRSLEIRYREECTVASDAALEKELRKRAKVSYLRGEGYLYTYVFHGHNIWGHSHHREIAETLSFSREWLIEHMSDLQAYLPAYQELPRALQCPSGEPISLVPPNTAGLDAPHGS